MKPKAPLRLWLIIAFGTFLTLTAPAATFYVDVNGTNPTPPYSGWSTAATNIQDAVDASSDSDLILVNDGVYQYGGASIFSSNRVAITKAVTVQSINGPTTTIIQGYQMSGVTNGVGSVRCVYLTNNATLMGFTLTNGATPFAGTPNGAGAFCWSASSILSNCIIVGNVAENGGGGAENGTLINCTLIDNMTYYQGGGGADSAILMFCNVFSNRASSHGGGVENSTVYNSKLIGNSTGHLAGNYGGGADSSTLINCAIIGNTSGVGGGTIDCNLVNCTETGNSALLRGGGSYGDYSESNCIFYFNSAPNGSNYLGSNPMNYCCTAPLPTNGGVGNIQPDPQLVDAFHVSANSPCIGAGSAVSTGTDIDGELWANPPSIGCDEYSSAASGDLSASIQTPNTNLVQGFVQSFTANISGWPSASSWDFGDGTVVSNEAYISHAWFTAGDFPVTLTAYNDTFPDGVSISIVVHIPAQTVLYVSASNTAPLIPYTSWATAATNIQDAVNAAWQTGSLILVSNGVYKSGSAIIYGTLSNRVAIKGPFTVQSVNGPKNTFIQGASTIGDSAVRCAYLTNGAVLIGFTLTNGGTRSAGDKYKENSGGDVWCESASAVVSNCVIVAGAAQNYGGGSSSGTLISCTLTNNHAFSGGGGSFLGILTNCSLLANSVSGLRIFGGGACSNTLYNCVLVKNGASFSGGGTYSCILSNCTLNGNWATNGGGATYGLLFNCTLTNNSGFNGGATASNALDNCFIANNWATNNGGGSFYGVLTNCILLKNSATNSGGGADGGTLTGCLLTNNFAASVGGGAYSSILTDCMIVSNTAVGNGGGTYSVTATACVIRGNLTSNNGGGSYGSVLNRCVLTGNTCNNSVGGGSYGDTLNNCEVFQNYAAQAGGAYGSTLNNCTVVDNFSHSPPGGTSFCHTTNSIIYYNSLADDVSSTMYYCCSSKAITGTGNFTNVPIFLDNWYHLQTNSPCIDTGNSAVAAGSIDIDGRPRIVGSAVDVGATEFQGADVEPFISWLYQYSLPNDGSADYADSDGDGMNNWQEWQAGTNPTNSASVLKLSSPAVTVTNATITWQSVAGVIYYIQRNSDLTMPFTSIVSNIVGQTVSTSYVDASATNGIPYFYRVGVQ